MFSALASFLIFLIVEVLLLAVGVGIGIWYGMRLGSRRTQTATSGTSKPSQSSISSEQVRELLMHLHALSTGMADDVDEHSTLIASVGHQLRAIPEDGDTAVVLASIAQLVTDVVRANDRLQCQLREATRRIEQQARQIECTLQDALTDPVTEIPNRRAFDQHLEKRLSEKRRHATDVSLLMIDLDDFKHVNDRYGHQAGDAVLRGIAQFLQSMLRDLDVAARYGGEEFAAILPRTQLGAAATIAERLRAGVEAATFPFEDRAIRVRLSVGVAEAMPVEDSVSLIRRADAALYAAKQAGRNRGYFHNGAGCEPITHVEDGNPQDSIPSGTKSAPARASRKRSADDAAEQHFRPGGSAPRARRRAEPQRDVLGDLPGRHTVADELRTRFADWRRDQRPFALMTISLDDLSRHREQLGNDACDLALLGMMRLITDAVGDGLVANLEGGTLAAILPEANLAIAAAMAESLRNAVAEDREIQPIGRDSHSRITASLGVAEAIETDGHVSMISRAQSALHAAEQAGGNCVYCHNGRVCEPLANSAVSTRS